MSEPLKMTIGGEPVVFNKYELPTTTNGQLSIQWTDGTVKPVATNAPEVRFEITSADIERMLSHMEKWKQRQPKPIDVIVMTEAVKMQFDSTCALQRSDANSESQSVFGIPIEVYPDLEAAIEAIKKHREQGKNAAMLSASGAIV